MQIFKEIPTKIGMGKFYIIFIYVSKTIKYLDDKVYLVKNLSNRSELLSQKL